MNNKILVVDDDPLFLESLQLFLSGEGYLVNPIDRAALVSTAISLFQPDLILMDIRLGDGDGRKICDAIKNNDDTAHIPIILMTALSYAEISEFDCEADAIIGKPYQGGLLLGIIAGLLP